MATEVRQETALPLYGSEVRGRGAVETEAEKARQLSLIQASTGLALLLRACQLFPYSRASGRTFR